jgi:hypothetical protein
VLLLFARQGRHDLALGLVVAASIALLMGMSLWKLLVPPRFSATRCAFILIGLLSIVLLLSS